MIELQEFVKIQYLYQLNPSGKTNVFNKITSDLLYGLTGDSTYPLTIYVEDQFSKAIIKSIAKEEGLLSKTKILTFGTVSNGYTIAADKILEGIESKNILVVLDGDVDRTDDEKKKKIEKCLSGTEEAHDEKVNMACSLITQYCLPEDTSPEQFMHKCLVNSGREDEELVRIATQIQAVRDSHEWIYNISSRTGGTEEETAREIIALISNQEDWKNYINPIRQWLHERKDI